MKLKINNERDKFLTEVMGECWHEPLPYDFDTYKGYDECKICHQRIKYNNNFSTWEGFGKLWEWAQKQEWFPELIRQTCYYEMCRNEFSKGHKSIVNPDYFANAVYAYLKEK